MNQRSASARTKFKSNQKKNWSITVRPDKDKFRSIGATTTNSNGTNPYVEGWMKLGKDDISRTRCESRELHQARVKLSLKAKLDEI